MTDTLAEIRERSKHGFWLCQDVLKAIRELLTHIDVLTARIAELEEEVDTWKSVFPDIAPERVLPDRSAPSPPMTP
jgi:transposase